MSLSVVFSLKCEGLRSLHADFLDCVIPAWSAGIQADMDVSGTILSNLDVGYPCGMTKFVFLFSVDDCKTMIHFVVRNFCGCGSAMALPDVSLTISQPAKPAFHDRQHQRVRLCVEPQG